MILIMDISLEPYYYNKAVSEAKDCNVHITDSTKKLLAYKFSISEVYTFNNEFADRNNPEIQIELLNKILLDLTRSTESIEKLREKIIASLSTDNVKKMSKNEDLER